MVPRTSPHNPVLQALPSAGSSSLCFHHSPMCMPPILALGTQQDFVFHAYLLSPRPSLSRRLRGGGDSNLIDKGEK